MCCRRTSQAELSHEPMLAKQVEDPVDRSARFMVHDRTPVRGEDSGASSAENLQAFNAHFPNVGLASKPGATTVNPLATF